ncbi:hypothetical protein BE221DRAFT_64979 [Ostreococcus tauri]|uniref:Uncharacterized protein n=1 Tax=Ostreococcus tauri TaxID=70448 RepID=A0A1Y5HZ36_OSTTA|nr:hypothetical protein BE221DRAFT_64979 [Ostreococcus tauri]
MVSTSVSGRDATSVRTRASLLGRPIGRGASSFPRGHPRAVDRDDITSSSAFSVSGIASVTRAFVDTESMKTLSSDVASGTIALARSRIPPRPLDWLGF